MNKILSVSREIGRVHRQTVSLCFERRRERKARRRTFRLTLFPPRPCKKKRAEEEQSGSVC